MKRISQLMFISSLLCALPAVASADVTIGGARARGMGGAGLAIPFDPAQNYRLNPAFLAFSRKGASFQWPEIGFKLRGITANNIRDIVGDLNTGGLDSDKVIDLARQYSDGNKTVALGANIGFVVGGLALGLRGEVGLNSIPNQQLQTWAANGGDITNVDAGSRLDAYGYGYSQTEVGYGNTVRGIGGRMSFGFNVRRVKSYYAHKFADRDTIQSGAAGGVQNGSGIAGDFAQGESTGVDVGVIYSPPGANNVYLGCVVGNFIEPKIRFPFEAAGGGQPITSNGFDPFARSINFGFGFTQDRLILAADLIDVGNGANQSELRYGMEFALNKSLAIRAGYNTRTAFTYGFAFGSLNVQLGGQAPITLANSVRF